MRLLVITNLYPPADRGGYEQRCAEVTNELLRRGYEVTVLTSRIGVAGLTVPADGVRRSLHMESNLYRYSFTRFFLRRHAEEAENRRIVRAMVSAGRYDVVYIWGMWNLPLAVAAEAERALPSRVAYSMEGDWSILPSVHEQWWREPASHRFMRPLKAILARFAERQLRMDRAKNTLKLDHVHCVSEWLRDQLVAGGVRASSIRVIDGAVDTVAFATAAADRRYNREPVRLLYAGALVPDKGVHTAIEAVKRVVDSGGAVSLTVAGTGQPDYEARLHAQVHASELGSTVRFDPWVPKSEMPRLLAEHDVLVFPSHHETFGRIVAEAMASGMAVISTRVGGTAWMVRDGETALAIEPEDADGLARQIERLLPCPDLRRALATGAQQMALTQFTLDRMVDEIEEFLTEVSLAQADALHPRRTSGLRHHANPVHH